MQSLVQYQRNVLNRRKCVSCYLNFQFLQICNQFALFFLSDATAFLRGLDQPLKLAFKFGLFPSIQGALL